MRYLGLDLGTKTLGVSLSDVTHTIASAYDTLHFSEGDFDSLIEPLKSIVSEYKVEKIVLGLPKNMNNTIGESGERCLLFGDKISKSLNIPVIMQDERLSTIEATNYMLEADLSRGKRKKKIDSLAANIILQTYLDKEKGENNGK